MNDLVLPARVTIMIASRLARASYTFAVHRYGDNVNNDNNNPHFLEFIA